jgi:hypothetical protein
VTDEVWPDVDELFYAYDTAADDYDKAYDEYKAISWNHPIKKFRANMKQNALWSTYVDASNVFHRTYDEQRGNK